MNVVIGLILLAALAASFIKDRSTRKALIDMSLSIDNLNAELARLEAAAVAAVSKLAAPVSPDESPLIDAATARVKAVTDSIEAATPKT